MGVLQDLEALCLKLSSWSSPQAVVQLVCFLHLGERQFHLFSCSVKSPASSLVPLFSPHLIHQTASSSCRLDSRIQAHPPDVSLLNIFPPNASWFFIPNPGGQLSSWLPVSLCSWHACLCVLPSHWAAMV